MRILLTGTSGFVGSKVLKILLDKYDDNSIIALSSQNIDGIKTIDSLGYNFRKGYLCENGCKDVDVLLHMGAFTPKSTANANDINNSTSNINNTVKLIDELPNLKKIIFISTIDVYEETEECITESTKTIPSTMYGWSKLYCEQVVKTYCKQRNLTYEILRLGHVYGEGEEAYRKVMPLMIRNAINGETLNIYGDGKATRSYIYIDDVAKTIVNSLEVVESEIINVVGNEAISVEELALMIKKLSSDKVDIKYIPSKAKNRFYIFDNSKLTQKLISNFVPFREGLEREYKYLERMIKS